MCQSIMPSPLQISCPGILTQVSEIVHPVLRDHTWRHREPYGALGMVPELEPGFIRYWTNTLNSVLSLFLFIFLLEITVMYTVLISLVTWSEVFLSAYDSKEKRQKLKETRTKVMNKQISMKTNQKTFNMIDFSYQFSNRYIFT